MIKWRLIYSNESSKYYDELDENIKKPLNIVCYSILGEGSHID
jgi:hypothetical protein